MKRLRIDLDELQKAMEDIEREAFDYFLDRETGDIIILSEDIIARAHGLLEENFDDDLAEYDEVELDHDFTVPEWIEDEVELALDIFLRQPEQYARVPERQSRGGYEAMKEFTELVDDPDLKKDLLEILEGKGAFRRFKTALDDHPKARKQWYGLNAKLARREIFEWLASIGIDGEHKKE
ncbi:MAG: hypothetical protein EPN25_14715 [Nitrospirae bacterium]|nr:MAG: hypothetical protein EPN25_14715 [Nitrospirota bacterium]